MLLLILYAISALMRFAELSLYRWQSLRYERCRKTDCFALLVGGRRGRGFVPFACVLACFDLPWYWFLLSQ